VKYRVRTKDGELEYDSYEQLQQAAATGMIEDDDEILAENKTEWAKASSLVRRVRRPSGWLRPQLLWVYLALMLALTSLYFLLHHALLFGALSIFVMVTVLMKITNDQVRRR
jgi:hypothetical protein